MQQHFVQYSPACTNAKSNNSVPTNGIMAKAFEKISIRRGWTRTQSSSLVVVVTDSECGWKIVCFYKIFTCFLVSILSMMMSWIWNISYDWEIVIANLYFRNTHQETLWMKQRVSLAEEWMETIRPSVHSYSSGLWPELECIAFYALQHTLQRAIALK